MRQPDTDGESSEAAAGAPGRPIELDLTILRRILGGAAGLVLILGVVRLAWVSALGTDTILRGGRFFNLDGEASLPAWYSSSLMLVAAGLLLLFAVRMREAHRRDAWRWTVLAAIFVYLSIDEAISIHETLSPPMRAWLGGYGSIFYFGWVVVAAPLLLACGLYLLPALLRLPPPFRRRVAAAAVIFVGGAMGAEIAGAELATRLGEEHLLYRLCTVVEEVLEIAGLTLFIVVLLDLIAAQGPLAFRFRRS